MPDEEFAGHFSTEGGGAKLKGLRLTLVTCLQVC